MPYATNTDSETHAKSRLKQPKIRSLTDKTISRYDTYINISFNKAIIWPMLTHFTDYRRTSPESR